MDANTFVTFIPSMPGNPRPAWPNTTALLSSQPSRHGWRPSISSYLYCSPRVAHRSLVHTLQPNATGEFLWRRLLSISRIDALYQGFGHRGASRLVEGNRGDPCLAASRIVNPELLRSVVLNSSLRRPNTLATRAVQKMLEREAPQLLRQLSRRLVLLVERIMLLFSLKRDVESDYASERSSLHMRR